MELDAAGLKPDQRPCRPGPEGGGRAAKAKLNWIEMKHSILCVDDEVDNVDALERLFRRKYEVFKATSGAEALKILKQEKVALIVTDQRMPNMTGVEFLAES